MTKYPTKKLILKVLPYFSAAVVILGLVFVGSLDKNSDNNTSSVSMNAIVDNDYQVSVDQFSEFYMVANLSDTMQLASTDAVSSNFVTISVMQSTSQTSFDIVEKPNIVDTSDICQGICVHTVKEGETMDSIAHKYGLSTDQIRWSNGLTSTDVSPGQQLAISGTPGIVYTVKPGETAESIAEKYGSSASDIIALNNNLAAGARIVIPGGVLPETERPEYVAPSARRGNTYARTYTYYGSSSGRENLHRIYPNLSGFSNGNPMVPGNCTWFAWGWRNTHGRPMPGGGALGNARNWARVAAASGYAVNHSPAYGAVFQTGAGYYGHVGIVTSVNSDGSITVQEMNYAGYNVVTESTIPANQVGNFLYIH